MIENFLWSKQKWLRLHIESALYDFVKSEKEIMYNIPALLDSFAFNKMRFDTAVWMPVRFFYSFSFILSAYGLNWRHFIFAVLLLHRYSFAIFVCTVKHHVIQFQVSALWSFSLHAFFYILYAVVVLAQHPTNIVR